MEKEKINNALYKGEASFAPYPMTVSGPKIELEDKNKMVAVAHQAMQYQANQQITMLRRQAELLILQAKEIEDRLKISYEIYKTKLNFEPVIGMDYHLYLKNGNKVLSLVGPDEWGKTMPFDNHIAHVRLLGDRTWEILSGFIDPGMPE